ncbi:MAG: FecR domain-containing protein [Bacteroidota bacterium]
MTQKELLTIAEKVKDGRATDREINILNRFLDHRKQHSLRSWTDWEKDYEKIVKEELYAAVHRRTISNLAKTKGKSLFRRPATWYVAASVTVLCLVGMKWSYVFNDQSVPSVSYTKKATERGQKLMVTLHDGSTVRLNSESTIIYPEVWNDTIREITLIGEAFFEVEPNPDQPFVITTDNLTTIVLGTSFNIRAYEESHNILVTVATGKVQVSGSLRERDGTNLTSQSLEPGQQATFDKAKLKLTMSEVDIDNYIAWKEGIIRFDHIPLLEAFEILEQWYDVEIRLNRKELGTCNIDAKYKNESLDHILESMKFIHGISYETINDREILITGNACIN